MSLSSSKRKVATTVVSSTAPPVPPAVASVQKPTLAVLKTSLTTGVFIDSQFFLYSHRNLDGSMDKPLPIYANSEVLQKAADHFRSLISGGFCESYDGGGTGTPRRLRSRIAAEEYEYESDSDLDDDEVLEYPRPDTPSKARITDDGARRDISVATEPVVLPESGISPSKGSLTLAGASVNGGQFPNGVPILTEDPIGTSSSAATTEDDLLPIATDVPVRHVVVIPDVAFKTFEAFLYYTYSGEISFTTLRSQGAPSENQDQLSPKQVVACSPKSMYRLADKYGLTALKDLTAKNIRSQLSSINAMREILSRFSARYPDVMGIETEFICGPYRRLDSFTDLQVWTQKLANGELPHAADAFAKLIRRLAASS